MTDPETPPAAPVASPSSPSLARNRTAVMAELRRLLPGVEGLRKTAPFGLAALDSHLPDGGLTCGALHEVVPAREGALPAALGFIAAILAHISGEGEKIFFIMPAYGLRPYGPPGRLHGHGLRTLGLDPARLILVETASRNTTLWAIEETVRSAAPAAVAGFLDKLDLKSSQRLHLAATDAGLPLFLLRPAASPSPAYGGGWEGGSAAATRWRVAPAPAARDRFGLYARQRWHLHLERARNGRPGEWVVEYDHVAHRFSLAAALADPARARGANQTSEHPTPTKIHCA